MSKPTNKVVNEQSRDCSLVKDGLVPDRNELMLSEHTTEQHV